MNGAEKYYGKVIAGVKIDEGRDAPTICVEFTDDTWIELSDKGQSCCETRYARTDDDLTSLSGQVLRGFEVREAADLESEGYKHEICFLDVKTDEQTVTFSFHNEHNGYYGGFWMKVDTSAAEEVTP